MLDGRRGYRPEHPQRRRQSREVSSIPWATLFGPPRFGGECTQRLARDDAPNERIVDTTDRVRRKKAGERPQGKVRLFLAVVTRWKRYLGSMKPTISGVSLALLMAWMEAPASLAQTIDQPALPDHGFTFTYGVTNVQPEGFDWSAAFSVQNVNFDFIPTDSTAYADIFSLSDFGQQVPAQTGGVNLSYYAYTESSMEFWGGVDATGVQVVHPEPLHFFPYPFSVGEMHLDSLSFSFSASGLSVSRDMRIELEALASGTMLLPGEISFENTLQVAHTQFVEDSTVVSTGAILIEGIGYWAQDMPLPIAQTYTYTQIVDGDSTVLFVGAEFLVDVVAGQNPRGTAVLSAFPSPAQHTLTVIGQAGDWIQVLDVQGRIVERRQLQSARESWDVTGWPTGVNFLNIEGSATTRRVLITR